MIEDLRDDLYEKRLRLAELSKAQSKLTEYYLLAENLKHQIDVLHQRLIDEEHDVNKLDKLSASSVIYSLLGRLDEKVEKERREAAEAALKYRRAKTEYESHLDHIKVLEATIDRLKNAPQDHEKAYNALKKARIAQDEKGSELLELDADIASCEAQLIELNQAAEIGELSRKKADEIADLLDSTKRWGSLDMLGGGALTSMIKHRKIDVVHAEITALNTLMARFKSELADVEFEDHMQPLDIDQFTVTVDVLFDNIFTDFSVQKKITQAIEDNRQIVDSINEIDAILMNRKRDLQQQIRIKREALDKLLV